MIGYIKPEDINQGSLFGSDISLSADGNTMALGTEQARQLGGKVGIVYVFPKSENGLWAQQSRLLVTETGANDALESGAVYLFVRTGAGDVFGGAISLNSDSTTLAVDARFEDGNATGTAATALDQQDDSVNSRGAVYLY